MASLGELLEQGDLKLISDEATQRLRKNPNDGEAMLALAKVALVEGNDSRVTSMLQQAAAKADKQEVALLRAALFLKRKDYKRARELYQPLAAQENARPSALYGLGMSLVELDQPEEALGVLERLVAQAPPSPAFFFELGRAYLMTNRVRLAMRQLVRCLRLDPKQERAWFLIVSLLGNRGRLLHATSVLNRALEQVPDSQLLLGLADPESPAANGAEAPAAKPAAPAPPPKARGGFMPARSVPAQAPLPKDIHSEEFHTAMGNQLTALIQSGQAREALKRVREVQEQGVRTLGFALIEGLAHESLMPPDVEGTIRAYQDTSARFAHHWLPEYNLGRFLLKQGRRYTADAIKALTEAARRAPEEAYARFHLARAYYQDEKFSESASLLKQIMDETKTIDPTLHGQATAFHAQVEKKLPKKA